MYRTIDASFWTDPKVLSLPPNGKLLLVYLITNPHSHVSGIYYMPTPIMEHETGLGLRALDTLCDTLSGLGIAFFDAPLSVAWVRRMFFYQGRGEKNERAAAAQLSNLHGSKLIARFLAEYPAVAARCSAYPIGRVSGFGTPDQEQELEQELEQEQKTGIAARRGDASAQPPPPTVKPVMVFPCIGKNGDPREWGLSPAYLAELSAGYEGVDVLAECRKALAWVKANRPKTAKGMPAYLVNWLNRSTRSSPARGVQRQRKLDGLDGERLSGLSSRAETFHPEGE